MLENLPVDGAPEYATLFLIKKNVKGWVKKNWLGILQPLSFNRKKGQQSVSVTWCVTEGIFKVLVADPIM